MPANDQLIVANVTRQFDGRAVLRDVGFQASPGQTIAVVGPSGSGKSTLLNVIGSLDKPDAGSVRLGDIDVTALAGLAAADYRARHVGFVFQDHHLLPQLTGLENVLLPTLATKSGGDVVQRAKDLIAQVGVAARAHAFPAQLSGGERQRLAIARALINSPSLLLCDEPTGNLDRANALAVVEMFVALARRENVIVIMVTHNTELADKFDRCLHLVDGVLS